MVLNESYPSAEFLAKESDLSQPSSTETEDTPTEYHVGKVVLVEENAFDPHGSKRDIGVENDFKVSSGKEPSSTSNGAKDETFKPTRSIKEHDGDSSTLNAREGIVVEERGREKTQTHSDADLLSKADQYLQEERLLDAARLLRRINDTTLLETRHLKALEKAQHIEAAVVDLTSSPHDGWTKQGESHGNYDTIIYYKVDNATRLTARIETPIPPSLLVPLLSVFNESELYKLCFPSFEGLGIKQSIKLRQKSRANQIVAVSCNMPWPLSNREAVIEATAVDDIDENNHIVVKMETRHVGEEEGLVPPPENDTVRIDFEGGILFQKCPEDHPAFSKCKHPNHNGQSLILVCLTMFVDAHVQYVPQSLINFVTRTVLGRMFVGLLEVAEDIRDGKRPEHAKAIASKKDLYEWIEDRVEVMLDGMGENGEVVGAS